MMAGEAKGVESEEGFIGSGLSCKAVSTRRSGEERDGTGEIEEIRDFLRSKEQAGTSTPTENIVAHPIFHFG
jgi:hypothetical protein